MRPRVHPRLLSPTEGVLGGTEKNKENTAQNVPNRREGEEASHRRQRPPELSNLTHTPTIVRRQVFAKSRGTALFLSCASLALVPETQHGLPVFNGSTNHSRDTWEHIWVQGRS